MIKKIMNKEIVIQLLKQWPDDLDKISKISGYKIKQLIAIKAHISRGSYK